MSFLCSVHLEGYLNYVTSMCQTFLFLFREILLDFFIYFFYLCLICFLLLLFVLFLRQKNKYILYPLLAFSVSDV